MSGFEKNINVEYLRRSADQTRQLKELTYQLLNLDKPQTILDIGCGPGVDTVAMAKASHADSRITGIDDEQSMIDAANEFALNERVGEKVIHIKASATELPFQDASYGAVRAERLFQVIPASVASPQTIFNEAFRVLKPGGIMVLADTDWATASVNFSNLDMERRFVRFFSDVCRPKVMPDDNFYN